MAIGTKHHGIRTLADVRDRCVIVEGHWIWSGGTNAEGMPRMWAPHPGGKMAVQNGPRAVWQMSMDQAVPAGCKVYSACDEPLCVNPEHFACRRPADQGRIQALRGVLKGLPKKIAANRKTLMARSSVTPEIFDLILTSEKTGKQLEDELRIGRTTISRIRTGQFTSIRAVAGSPFAGLGARHG
jgi:hypothetical protein